MQKNSFLLRILRRIKKIIVKITVTIKKAAENIKNAKNVCSLGILRRIQKERLLHDITVKL